MTEFKGIKLRCTAYAYVSICKKYGNLTKLCEKIQPQKSEDGNFLSVVETSADLLAILANAHISSHNLQVKMGEIAEEPIIIKYDNEYFLERFTFLEIVQSANESIMEIAHSMNIDVPSGIELQEKDEYLEEYEQEKKINLV